MPDPRSSPKRSPRIRRVSGKPHDFPTNPRGVIDSVDWLIDNEIAFARVDRAVREARKSVWIAQLGLDSDCVLNRTPGTSRTLVDLLLEAASERCVDVRVLLNATLLLDTTKPLRRLFRQSALSPSFQMRGVSAFPQLFHSKVVIVDGTEGFIVGSPFVNDYWDSNAHLPFDPARPTRELAGRPLHDVSLALKGPVVQDLEALFTELWTLEEKSTVAMQTRRAAHALRRVEVVSTMPAGRSATTPQGTTAILGSLLNEIRCAESLIYIEHQYLSSRKIVAALAKALARNRALEIIMVLNQNPDITAYQRWQNARLSEAGLFSHSRVGLFSLWSATRKSSERTLLNQIFIHSKVVTVDDRIAIVGSANLDGVSLDSYGDDFSGWLGRTIFRDVRDFDIAVVVSSAKESNSPNAIVDLRTRLWSEHLLATRSAPTRVLPGSLDEWRETARFNVAALSDRESAGEMRGHVLPYSRETMPRRQLRDIGIDIRSAGIDLKFDPTWFNVRFSPNWIRNMFL